MIIALNSNFRLSRNSFYSHAVETENASVIILELALRDPEAIERLKLRNGGASNPARVLSISWSHERHFAVMLRKMVLNALV